MVKQTSNRRPSGYWTYDNTITELKKVIAEFGCFPTEQELSVIKLSSLMWAIRKHGGTNRFRELLGLDIIKKTNGYWTEENTIKELKSITNNLGHFPTQGELCVMERYDLTNQITIYGGINRFRTLLGYEIIQKSKGYWTHEYILNELTKIITQLGHFPKKEELNDINRSDLANQIAKHGGSNKFRRLLGYDLLKKPNGYWTSNTTRKALIKTIAKIGHFPSQKEIQKMKLRNLGWGIQSNGGSNKFRKLLGEEAISQKPSGYWTYNNTFDELKKLITQLGHFPSQEEFNTTKQSSLYKAITKHGGIELDIVADEHIINKIERYKKCTFHTKNEFIRKHLNKGLDSYVTAASPQPHQENLESQACTWDVCQEGL